MDQLEIQATAPRVRPVCPGVATRIRALTRVSATETMLATINHLATMMHSASLTAAKRAIARMLPTVTRQVIVTNSALKTPTARVQIRCVSDGSANQKLSHQRQLASHAREVSSVTRAIAMRRAGVTCITLPTTMQHMWAPQPSVPKMRLTRSARRGAATKTSASTLQTFAPVSTRMEAVAMPAGNASHKTA